MIQSVKNDSVHLKQIETNPDDFRIWLNVSSELNDEMPILNGYNFYRPVIQIHPRKTIDIDKHLFDTDSLTVKLSIILVDLRLIAKSFACGSKLCPDFDEKKFSKLSILQVNNPLLIWNLVEQFFDNRVSNNFPKFYFQGHSRRLITWLQNFSETRTFRIYRNLVWDQPL